MSLMQFLQENPISLPVLVEKIHISRLTDQHFQSETYKPYCGCGGKKNPKQQCETMNKKGLIKKKMKHNE